MGKSGSKREKLGLCLAGGGFRASLFHLGVLHRMAELDLLRYVEVLSTVSGGSIIGALYALLLKKYLDKNAELDNETYLKIVAELEFVLTGGIQKNLRTRLFMCPHWTLRVMLTSESLGESMSRLYGRHFYSHIVKDLGGLDLDENDITWGRIALKDIRINPGGNGVPGGLEKYNREAVEAGPEDNKSVITKLVLNATSLNSGKPFIFSGIEIGDEQLGYFRYDELDSELIPRKALLDKYRPKERTSLEEKLKQPLDKPVSIAGIDYARKTASLVLWWLKRQFEPQQKYVPHDWESLFNNVRGFPGRLVDVEFGRLRKLKLSAWYLRKGPEKGISGGLNPDEHLKRFWEDLGEFDATLSGEMKGFVGQDDGSEDYKRRLNLVLDFALELYYIRSAEVMDKGIKKSWEKLTLAGGVGASACFPPVFPPFIMLDLYDDLHVTRLGLTDGGVYDNVGLISLLDEECTHIIASDTSGLFDTQKQSSEGRIGMSGRIVSILMDDVAAQQRERLRELKRCGKLDGLSYFHIQSPSRGNGLELPFKGRQAAALRTDLDGFGDVEIAALVNQGYDTADRYIREYLCNTVYHGNYYDKFNKSWEPPKKPPIEILPDKDVNKILKAGRSRFFRIYSLRPLPAWTITIITALLVIFATLDMPFSLRNIGNGLMGLVLNWIKFFVPLIGGQLAGDGIALGVLLLLLGGLIAVWPAWRWLREKFKNRYLKQFRWLFKLGKLIRAHAGVALILIYLLPFVLSIVGAVVSWISYIGFHLPFMAATRNTNEGSFSYLYHLVFKKGRNR